MFVELFRHQVSKSDRAWHDVGLQANANWKSKYIAQAAELSEVQVSCSSVICISLIDGSTSRFMRSFCMELLHRPALALHKLASGSSSRNWRSNKQGRSVQTLIAPGILGDHGHARPELAGADARCLSFGLFVEVALVELAGNTVQARASISSSIL